MHLGVDGPPAGADGPRARATRVDPVKTRGAVGLHAAVGGAGLGSAAPTTARALSRGSSLAPSAAGTDVVLSPSFQLSTPHTLSPSFNRRPSSVVRLSATRTSSGVSSGVQDLGGIFAACRDATVELELAVRAAASHREKCTVVLGAAVAVNIALSEAVAVSPALDAQTQTQLKRLCSGILSTLGLAVARVRVYGQYTRAQKMFRLMRYAATESKFDELRRDLEVLEGQLWNLTGAVGGLGTSGTVSSPEPRGGSSVHAAKGARRRSAGPDTHRRLTRGSANMWVAGGDVRVMCAAGVDGSELWWASNRSASLSVYDLFLQSKRDIDGVVDVRSATHLTRPGFNDGSEGGRRAPECAGGLNGRRVPPFGCLGMCTGDVTAMAAEEGSALLWTGTTWGGVVTWDTDAGGQWGVAAVASLSPSSRRGAVAVSALTPVAPGTAWVGLADGSLLEVEAAAHQEGRAVCVRQLSDPGARPIRATVGERTSKSAPASPTNLTGTEIKSRWRPEGRPSLGARAGSSRSLKKTLSGRLGRSLKKTLSERLGMETFTPRTLAAWGSRSAGRRKRHGGAAVREMLRLGATVWASCDDSVLEAWDVASGACAAVSPHRDLGQCVAIVPHAAAGQLVTVHATGAVQTWWATDDAHSALDEGDARADQVGSLSKRRAAEGGTATWLGTRAEQLAGPRPAKGKVVGAAVVDKRLLCIGHANGLLKVMVLPHGDGDKAGTPPASSVPARIRAHRSGMVLLRAVDGGGHVGVATAGRFGSITLWPLAELEAAVAAAQPPGARVRGAGGVTGHGSAAAAAAARVRGVVGSTPRTSAGGGYGDSTDSGRGGSRRHSLSRAGSSLGSNTALIPFEEITLKKCVGEGSFGRVYVAVWSNHTEVAVKLIGPPASFAGRSDPLLWQKKGAPSQVLAVGANAGPAGGVGAGDGTPSATAGGTGSGGEVTAGDHGGEPGLHRPRGASGLMEEDEAGDEGDDAAAAELLDELEKEVTIMARLRHPNIVLLLGAVRSPPAIVEEFCARGSLFSVLQRHAKPGVPPLEWRVRLQMALGAAAGMCYLHNCSPPVIHRDLKSPNLMVDRYFRVKVGDFNLSRIAMASASIGGPDVTSIGGLHSPRWMAPEVLQSATYSRASDVYSFAMVMWEIRSLQVPFAALGQWQVMHSVVEEQQRPPLDEDPTPNFSNLHVYDDLIRDGWVHSPDDRPAFEEIITRLQKLIDAHAAATAGSDRTRRLHAGHSAKKAAAGGAGRGSAMAGGGGTAAASGGGPNSTGLLDAHQQHKQQQEHEQQQHAGAGAASGGTAGVIHGGGVGEGVDAGAPSGAVMTVEGEDAGGVVTAAEAEEVIHRIVSRKRSSKFSMSIVPRSVAAAAADAEVQLRRTSSPFSAAVPVGPTAAHQRVGTPADGSCPSSVSGVTSAGHGVARGLPKSTSSPVNSGRALPGVRTTRRSRSEGIRIHTSAVPLDAGPGDQTGGDAGIVSRGEEPSVTTHADAPSPSPPPPQLPPTNAMLRAIAARKNLRGPNRRAHTVDTGELSAATHGQGNGAASYKQEGDARETT